MYTPGDFDEETAEIADALMGQPPPSYRHTIYPAPLVQVSEGVWEFTNLKMDFVIRRILITDALGMERRSDNAILEATVGGREICGCPISVDTFRLNSREMGVSFARPTLKAGETVRLRVTGDVKGVCVMLKAATSV